MKKQNIAVFLSSLILLATLVPSLVTAQGVLQEGTLTLTGAVDLFFEGYDITGEGNPGQLTFAGLTAKSSDQTTVLNYAEGSFIDQQFIGVLDLDNNDQGWSVTVNGDATFTDSTSLATFEADTLGYVTTPHGFASAPTIDCFGTDVCSFATTLNNSSTLINDLLYYVDTGSGYIFVDGEVTAPNNVEEGALNTATYVNIKNLGTASTMLDHNPSDPNAQGLFGTGMHFKVGVPGGTAAGTYVGTITYDLNMKII